MSLLPRLLLMLAGLLGAAGVAAAAAASHSDARNLSAIATIFLAHAPVLLALGLFGRGRVLLRTGVVLAVGTIVFGADLSLRQWTGSSLFPGAAPLGGVAIILGWLGLVAAAVLGRPNIDLNKD